MNRRIALSLALALSFILVSLTSSGSTANAQNRLVPVLDTGVLSIGPDQTLSVRVAVGDVTGDNIRVRFRRFRYNACSASPKLCIESQTVSERMTLAPNEAASIDVAEPGNWRFIVESTDRNVPVNGIVFDTSTQRVVAICCTSTTMYLP